MRGCHDDLIGRVTVKDTWQLCRLDGDLRREFEQPHTRVGQRLVEPLAHRYGQVQAVVLDEFSNLPARDGADPKPCALVILNVGFMRGWQLVVAMNPTTQICVSSTIISLLPNRNLPLLYLHMIISMGWHTAKLRVHHSIS